MKEHYLFMSFLGFKIFMQKQKTVHISANRFNCKLRLNIDH